MTALSTTKTGMSMPEMGSPGSQFVWLFGDAPVAPSCELDSPQQARRRASKNLLAVRFRDVERPDAGQHLVDAADLVGIVAAGDDVVGAREADRELDRPRI